MFGFINNDKEKKSVFGEKRKNVELGTFQKNRKVVTESVLKDESECDSVYDSLSDAKKEKNDAKVDKTFECSFVGECLFPVLLIGVFVFATSWLSDSNETELEARRNEVAQTEIAANVKVLKSIEAKNPKEPLPDTLELVAATELGKNNVAVLDPWGKPYVYDKKNRLLCCVVRNSDGSIRYEIARRF